MRYERIEKYSKEKSTETQKVRRQKERKRKLDEKNATSRTHKWTQLRATVVSSPVHVCTIQRQTIIQPEVIVTCSVYENNKASLYKVRFLHKRTLQLASELKTGDLLLLEECRFSAVSGRKDNELLVKRASKIYA
jgi:hypothetical protein